ncbi:MAG TPA: hypothetical protein VGH70_15335 [Bradyrhizobium sp.]|jgi:hypothetical protein
MIARKAAFPSTRATALGLATAVALTAVVPTVASAASPGEGLTAATGSMTDISARRRGFNPAAAAVAGVVGFGIAAAAANANAYYDDGYGYYGGPGPVYVAPGPGYYYGGGYGGYGYRSGVPADQHGHPLAGW